MRLASATMSYSTEAYRISATEGSHMYRCALMLYGLTACCRCVDCRGVYKLAMHSSRGVQGFRVHVQSGLVGVHQHAESISVLDSNAGLFLLLSRLYRV
jgi:hypothetical protein